MKLAISFKNFTYTSVLEGRNLSPQFRENLADKLIDNPVTNLLLGNSPLRELLEKVETTDVPVISELAGFVIHSLVIIVSLVES